MMSTLFVILFLLLFALLGALSVWGLAVLAYQERWKEFFLCMLLPPLAGAWLLWEGYRAPKSMQARYLLDGILLAASLFLPIWVTGGLLIALVLFETFVIFSQEEDEEDV